MIHNDHRIPDFATLAALGELEDAEFTVYLTGSRFFRTANTDSDWDFFIGSQHKEFDAYLKQWLEERGWEPVNKHTVSSLRCQYEGDPNIAEVYEKGAVQLQLVRDEDVKIEAQELLLKNLEFLSLSYAKARNPRLFYHRYAVRRFWVEAMEQAVKNLYDQPKDLEDEA